MADDPRFKLQSDRKTPITLVQVKQPYAPLYATPSNDSPQQMELVFGQGVEVFEERDGWAYGRVVPLVNSQTRPTYVGWVEAERLQTPTSEPDHRVSVLSAPIFSKADLKSPIIMSLPLGSQLSVRSEQADYHEVGDDMWVHKRHLTAKESLSGNIVDVARLYLGQPYVWGGNGARGVDCSGLVQMSLAACGIDAPRDADQQEECVGARLDFETGGDLPDLKRGDLLFWPGHVGILSVPDRLLHANATHMSTVDEPLEPALARMKKTGVRLRSIRRI